jgi:predicted transposase YdaD
MEYSIVPKRLGERRIIHYPQKRIIGLYVMDVCLTEYNEEVFVNGIREDGRADGRAEERTSSIRTLLRKGKSPAEIHDLLDYPMEEIVEVSKKLQ